MADCLSCYLTSTSAMSDDEDEPLQEDARIVQLYNFADKRCDEDGKYTGDAKEFSDYVESLGTDSSIVNGSMMMNRPVARAYFIVSALIDSDGEEEATVAECINLKMKPLKACVESGGEEAAKSLLAALESYVSRMEDGPSQAKNVKGYAEVLKHLWEWEIVDEDTLKAWVEDERAGRAFDVPVAFARKLREGAGQVFLQWLEEGE